MFRLECYRLFRGKREEVDVALFDAIKGLIAASAVAYERQHVKG